MQGPPRITRRLAAWGAALAIFGTVVMTEAPQAHAGVSCARAFSATGGVSDRGIVKAVGETFLTSKFTIPYALTNTMILAGGNCGALGEIYVDDVIVVKIQHPDLSVAKYTHDFSNGCTGQVFLSGPDLSSYFVPGNNVVTVLLKDKCGSTESSTGLWFDTFVYS